MKVKCTSSFYVIDKGVFNIHEIVEFDDELAKKLIEQGVVELIEEKQTKKEEDYKNLTVKELKELLQKRGLDTKGKKQELIKRLENN